MNKAQRDIRRKTRVLEHAARIGNVRKTCRYIGVARPGFYVWKKAYEAKARAAVRQDFKLTCVPARCTVPRDPKVSSSRPEAHVRAQRSEPSGSRRYCQVKQNQADRPPR